MIVYPVTKRELLAVWCGTVCVWVASCVVLVVLALASLSSL